VTPHKSCGTRFNAYLDENIRGPEPYEAIVLDSFAQPAMEADVELDERRAG
jgi:hypothetical protein